MVSMGLQTDNERQHASLIPLPTTYYAHVAHFGYLTWSLCCQVVCRQKISALQTCLPIPLLAHRWLILGIAHGSHAVIGVVVLSEGLQT